VADERADVGAAAISITAERERSFDFSQPILNAGLQILVPANDRGASTPGLRNFLNLLFSKTMLVWLAAALAITVIPAHIVWLIERRHANTIVSKSYFPGILQAFAWGLGTLAAQSDSFPRHWFTRLLSILWAFVSIIFVAFYTATLTTTLTVQKFEVQIRGPADLLGW
jgi:polar amino acid transport system substrate-binding protein